MNSIDLHSYVGDLTLKSNTSYIWRRTTRTKNDISKLKAAEQSIYISLNQNIHYVAISKVMSSKLIANPSKVFNLTSQIARFPPLYTYILTVLVLCLMMTRPNYLTRTLE